MALRIAKTLGTGVTGDYWHIRSLSADKAPDGWKISGHLALFVSEEARRTGKSPIDFLALQWPLTTPLVDIFADAYRVIKTLPEFEGAEDC